MQSTWQELTPPCTEPVAWAACETLASVTAPRGAAESWKGISSEGRLTT